MKLSTAFISLIAYQAAGIFATQSDLSAEAECGALGVMEYNVEDLAPGVQPSDVRPCKEHPLSFLKRDGEEHALVPRRGGFRGKGGGKGKGKGGSCYQGPAYGCDNGYCYSSCKSGWCWMAARGGHGMWMVCKKNEHCNPKYLKGAGCGQGDCKACGCGC